MRNVVMQFLLASVVLTCAGDLSACGCRMPNYD